MREYSFYEAFNFHQGKALRTTDSLRVQVEQLIMSQTKIMVGKKKPRHNRSFIRSHFGGIPYFEKGEKWPVQKNSGEPMEFVCQFVDTGQFPFPKNVKLFQLYFAFNNLYDDNLENAWHIKTYQNIHIDKYMPVSNPLGYSNPFYNPVYMISDVSFPDYETAVTVNPMIQHLSKKISHRKPYAAYNKIVNHLSGETVYGSAICGYPNWLYHETNFDLTFYKKGYRLLAQLDNECEADLCWGDVGTAYLFYNPNKTNDYQFALQAF